MPPRVTRNTPARVESKCEPDLQEALAILRVLQDEHFADFIYDVREREGLDWDGPRVTAWGNAAERTRTLLEKYRA